MEPTGVDLNDNAQAALTGSIFSTWVLAVTAVVLRFISRRIARAGLWIDDWLMLPALAICTLLTFVAGVWQIDFGFGKHIYVLPDQARSSVVMLQALFIAELCYAGAVISVKGSILALYWRLFKLKVKIPVFVIAFLVLCWGLAVFFITLLQCFPLKGFWDKSVPAKCGVNDYLFFYGNSIPNIITDFALLGLPLPCIWNLKVQRSQKFILSGMFILGGFVVAVGIYRLKVLLDINAVSPDITWTLWPSQLWTSVELNVAVISAKWESEGCLPSLRPVLNLVLARFTGLNSSRSIEPPQNTDRRRPRFTPWPYAYDSTAYSNTGPPIEDDQRPFARLPDDKKKPPNSEQNHELQIVGGNTQRTQVENDI